MLEALAAVLLGLLMFLPILNIGIGAVAGFFIFGFTGAAGGALAGWIITATVYKNPYL